MPDRPKFTPQSARPLTRETYQVAADNWARLCSQLDDYAIAGNESGVRRQARAQPAASIGGAFARSARAGQQRGISAVKKKAAKKKPGRKPKGGRAYLVKLTDAVADQLRRLGDGNLTRGIETAAHVERTRS